MFNINLLKKYAISYLSKYDSTKKNLERILKNKIIRTRDINKYIIDMSPYQSGLYFITIKTTQTTQTVPIIKK